MAKKPEEWTDEERSLHDQLKQDWFDDVIQPEVERANEQSLGGAPDPDPPTPAPPPAEPEPTTGSSEVLSDNTVKSLASGNRWGWGIAPPALWGVLILIVILLVAFIPGLLSDDGDDPSDDPAAAAPVDQAEDADDDQIALAAGTYRLSEESARRSVEPTVAQFESAEGAIVVEEDGTLSGDFTYVFLDPFEEEGLARVTADSTLDPSATSELVVTESGLAFDATLVVSFSIVPPASALYTNPGTGTPVSGLLDLQTGTIEISQSGGPAGQPAFEFVR